MRLIDVVATPRQRARGVHVSAACCTYCFTKPKQKQKPTTLIVAIMQNVKETKTKAKPNPDSDPKEGRQLKLGNTTYYQEKSC